MTSNPYWLWLLAGFALGVGATLLVWMLRERRERNAVATEFAGLRAALSTQQLECARLEERLQHMLRVDQQLDEREDELRALQAEYSGLQGELRALQTRLEEERSKQQEKLQLLEQAGSRMQAEFRQLAQGIFEDNSRRFGTEQQAKMEHLLQPLREQLGEFRRRVDDVYDKEAKDRRGLQEQVEQLKQLNLRMSADAVNLTNALKGDNKTQGNWGEVVLERVLEESGLRRGHEYELQVSRVNAAGQRYQPDAIVHLPENKDVVIDSKVTLVAYERAVASQDAQSRQQALAEHLQALKRHIKGLSEKSYQELEGVRSLDFVLLFIPIEAALMAALEQDAELFGAALQKNIVLVTPATLLVTLKTIHHSWRNEKQSRHAQEIARQGGELYAKFVGFVEALEEVGRSLEQAQRAYGAAHKRLSSGRGSLVSRVQGLTALGVQAKKSLPERLLEQAEWEPAEVTIITSEAEQASAGE